MLKKLLAFEISLQIRQFSFWIVMFIMFTVGLLAMSVDWFSVSIEGGQRAKQNGANALAVTISFLSLGAIFFSSVFVVTGMMRDDVHKFLEIMHSMPVKNTDLVVPRLIGAFLATFLSVFAAVIGLFVGQFMPWVDKEVLGPINLLYFIHPTLIFLFLNALFFTAFFTLIAGFTRNKMLVYVSAIGLLSVYFGTSLMTQDAPKWLASLVEPLGGNALALETQYWPAAERNVRLTPLYNHIGLNRLFWGAVTCVMLLSSYKLFNRGLIKRTTKLVEGKTISVGPYRPVKPAFGLSGDVSTLLSRIKVDYLGTVKSISFYVLCGIALFLIGLIWLVTTYFSPEPTIPTSASMARLSVAGFGLPVLLVTIFFSGDIIWRDRTAKFNEILDATPVKNWQFMLSKWVALSLTILTMFAFAMVVGISIQLLMGSFSVNLVTYFKIIFVGTAAPFILSAGLALFAQNFMPNRIVGMFAAAAILIFFSFVVGQLPFFHPLMNIGSLNTGSFSEFNGYESLLSYKWFGIYNLLILGFLAVVSAWLWRRGLQTSLKKRLGGLPGKLTPISVGLALVFLAGSIGTGAKIHGAYDAVDYRNSKAREKRSVAYEKLFEDLYKRPVPKIRSVEVDVDISPSKREGTFSGSYVVENVTGSPLEELFVNVPTRHEEDILRLDVAGAKRDGDRDDIDAIEDFGYLVYKFDKPVPPGAKFRMDFSTYFHPPRLVDGSRIRRNGTFVNNFQVMPFLEIEDNWLRNPDKRRKNGLPKLPLKADQTDEEARQHNFISRSADYVDFKARVCTDPDQIPIAPGHMISKEDISVDGTDRHCRSYEAINPILNFYSFLSADYVVKRDVWDNPNGKDVDVAIYYHEAHDYNVDLMLEATKNALGTFTETFGPYQYKQARIMEFPHGNFAQAFAGTIPFSENIGFVRDPGDPNDPESIDLASYVTMHEIGHQWFAHQIVPANTKGFNVLSEGLTENAAMTAYEAAFDWKRARRVLEKRAIESYLANRVIEKDNEPALANAGNQQYMVYNKASWVFWGLKQYMGEEAMQGAIRGFLAEYGSTGPPYPTTHQLIEYLRAAAGDDYQQLITDYWERITFWELSMDEVELIEKNGKFEFSMLAKVDKKIASEESGKETSVTEIDGEELSEWIEVGFYDKDPKDTLGADWLALERVKVTDLESTLSFTLDTKPTHVLLDPRRLLIERNVTDNVKKIEAKKPEEG